MNFSFRIKCILFSLLIILNILIRYPIEPHEVGIDSFQIHILSNSISEFGRAQWILNPLSFFGFYPISYVSSVPFFISALSQTLSINSDFVVFIYSMFLGILSIFVMYILAAALFDNDLYKFLVTFSFSISGAILNYTTWTMPTRGLFVIIAPFIIFLLVKLWHQNSNKYVLLILFFSVFLISTHHMFYFLIPIYVSFLIIWIYCKFKDRIEVIRFPGEYIPVLVIIGFLLMFSIPFVFGKFVQTSRYSPVYLSYARYMGFISVFAIGSLVFLIFKQKKNHMEWLLLLSVMFLTPFMYIDTYFKWFIPMVAIPIGGIGLSNLKNSNVKERTFFFIIGIFIITSISFSGYFQFIHTYKIGDMRGLDENTYEAGTWIKNFLNGVGVSNDLLFGERIFANSDTSHLITPDTSMNYIYGIKDVNVSNFIQYSVSSEEFFYDFGQIGQASGEQFWFNINIMDKSIKQFNLSFFVENVRAGGYVVWHHTNSPVSKLLQFCKDNQNLLYDSGSTRVWNLNN